VFDKLSFYIGVLVLFIACDRNNVTGTEKAETEFYLHNQDSSLIFKGAMMDSKPSGAWSFYDKQGSPLLSIYFAYEESTSWYTIYSYHEKKLLYKKVVENGEIISSDILDYEFKCSSSLGQLLYRDYFSELFMMEGLKGRVDNNALSITELRNKLISYQTFYRSKGILFTVEELECVIQYLKS
jgi:hypothetical protein